VTRIITALGLVAFLLPAAVRAQASDTSTARKEALQIVVRDGNRGPLAGAQVQRLDRRGQAVGARLVTDGTGEARVPLPSPRDRVRLRIRRLGYTPLTLDLRPDTVRGVMRVDLAPIPQTLGQVCTTDALPGIVVRLVGPVLQDTVTVRAVATDGRYRDDSVREFVMLHDGLTLAHERPGTYTVAVSAPGYQLWRRRRIRVPAATDGCHHVQPQVVMAQLVPKRER
jgi:hypothetical protein